MDFYPATLPIPPVASYMCQPSPPQPTAVPPNIYPALLPPTPHDLTLRKIPAPCTLIPTNPFPTNAMTIVHLPTNLLQTLRREPLKYNRDDMVSTCSSCGQTNTLWDIRVKKLTEEAAQDYELKRYLMQELRFEPFPGEEPPPPPPPPHSVASNNIGYPTQPSDVCKISNLRANANEFTPGAQKNFKSSMQSATNNAFSEECDYHQSPGRLSVTESNTESAPQDSNVSDSSNQDAASSAIDSSIPEKYPIQNDCVISSHGGSTESVNNNSRTDGYNSSKRNTKINKKNVRSTCRRDTLNEPTIKMDSNRNYKSSDDMNMKRDKTSDTRIIYANEHQRPNSRNSDFKKGGSLNGKPNGLPPRSLTYANKSRSYEKRSGDSYNEGGFGLPSKPWNKSSSSNGSVPRKSSRRTSEMSLIHEIEGDLFTASPEYSLAHCVAEDFRMGAGIAVQFKKLFGHVGDLLNQRKTVGEVAYLEHEGRYIFYLITKKFSYAKPTLETMLQALKSLRDYCEKLNVKKLAMPLIGCGLDKLRWEDVKQLLYDEFCQTDVEIFVYHREPQDEQLTHGEVPPISNKSSKLKIVEAPYPLIEIDCNTALVVYGTADGKVDKANEPLNKKFSFLDEFEKKCKSNSSKENFYPFLIQDEYVCILIVRNTLSEPFDFVRLEYSIRKFNTFLKANQYQYVGIERIEDATDPLINDKIISVFRNSLSTTVDLYVCSSPPKMYSSNMSSSSSASAPPKYSSFSSNVNSTASSN